MPLRLSITGIASVFAYIVLLLVYMMILPYGDEPDFIARLPEYVILLENLNLSYYSDGMTRVSVCKYLHNPLQIFGKYDFESCFQNIELSLKRAFFTFVIFLPIVIISLSVRKLQDIQYSKSINSYFIQNEAIKLSLVFPSFIYYSSLFSIEQVTLMLSVLFIYTVFRAKYIFAITSLTFLWILDQGKATVVILIFLYTFGSIFIYRKVGFQVFLLLNLIVVLSAYFISSELIYLLKDSGISQFNTYVDNKLDQFIIATDNYDVSERWPNWLRPIMTFMSYTFMPPALSKHLILYLSIALGLISLLIKCADKEKFHKIDKMYLVVPISVISIIMIFVFILPGYNNAKYYIFTLPVLVNTLLYYFSFSKIIIYFIFLNIIVFTDYLLFYAIGCSDCGTFVIGEWDK